MNRKIKSSNPFFAAFKAKTPDQKNLDEREIKKPDFFDSDLHGGNGIMMAEIYGSDFQKVWRKTRKKWWA
ncbi:MAG: hypothetical protein NPINA01_19900 [Nitrospinaceae bacterium]|nr:MAG: hypothetical protein NPINA01_19900 [Nitrospinaceae bacterium]